MTDLNKPFWDINHFLETFVERLAAENILIIFCSSSWKHKKNNGQGEIHTQTEKINIK